MNRFENTIQLLQNVVVPKAQDPPTVARQALGSDRILARIVMLPTIDLDYEKLIEASKVDDVRWYWVLSAKLIASQLTISQVAPYRPFSVGLILP